MSFKRISILTALSLMPAVAFAASTETGMSSLCAAFCAVVGCGC